MTSPTRHLSALSWTLITLRLMVVVGASGDLKTTLLPFDAPDTYTRLQNLIVAEEGRGPSINHDIKLTYGGKKLNQSPIYYIKLPPTQHYFTKDRPVKSVYGHKKHFGKVPVQFRTNGKPANVYHFKSIEHPPKQKLKTKPFTSYLPPVVSTKTSPAQKPFTSYLPPVVSIKTSPAQKPLANYLPPVVPIKALPVQKPLTSYLPPVVPIKTLPAQKPLTNYLPPVVSIKTSSAKINTFKPESRITTLYSPPVNYKPNPNPFIIKKKVKPIENKSNHFYRKNIDTYTSSPVIRINSGFMPSNKFSRRTFIDEKNTLDGRPSGLYLWKSYSPSLYKPPTYIKFKH